MSLKHAILGFLSYKPMSGYELKKVFDRSVRHFWPANQSQIYRTLADLDEEDFVSQEIIARDDRLDLKIYHITESGLDELHRWLSSPLPHQDFREAFLIQIYFGGKLTDNEMIPLIKREIQTLEETQNLFSEMFQMYSQKSGIQNSDRDQFFSMLPLEYGIYSNQAALTFLKSSLNRLETQDYSPRQFEDLIS